MTSHAITVAFGAGMVATINPCGFAMLPAYLSYFLGLDDPSMDSRSSVLRAMSVGTVMTAGFILVFGVIGLLLQGLALPIEEHVPWVTMVIGVVLVGLGIAMLAGLQPTLSLPRLERGGDRRTLASMFVFGVSYALASLSCTLPIFLVTVLGVFSSDSFGQGLSVFVAYGLGMGLLLTAITVAIALARHSVVRHLRKALPHIHRIAGGLLVLAGGFLVYWAWWELQVLAGNLDAGGPADLLLSWQGRASNWISETGALRIGLVLTLFMGLALAAASWRASRRVRA